MKKLHAKAPDLYLCLLCYGAGLALLFCVHLGGFALNRIARAQGKLEPAELTVADFTLHELEQRGDTLVTTGGDPQLLWKETGRRVDGVLLDISYARPPGKVNVFWSWRDLGYSVRRMAYADAGGRAWLPPQGGAALRIDPGAAPGNVLTVHRILVNPPRPWISFFIPSAGEWAAFLLLPGLLACAVQLVRQARDMLRARKAVRPL